MAVETFTNIASLNPLWPPGTDTKQEGDNHIRGIKTVIKNDCVSKAELTAAMPIGAVLDYAGAVAPIGWLLCFGQAVSRTTYSALFSLLGGNFGVGDGSTTFNVPDLRGRVAAGADDMGGTAANRLAGWVFRTPGGSQGHNLTEAEMPPHSHTVNVIGVGTGVAAGTGYGGVSGPTSTVGGGAGHNNVQPTMALNKIIKT